MTDSQSQPCGAEKEPPPPSAEPSAVSVSYSFEYRNYASHEWRPASFRREEQPADLRAALADLSERVKRWVPGTQLRLVVTTRSTSVSPPFGVFNPVRTPLKGEAASPADRPAKPRDTDNFNATGAAK